MPSVVSICGWSSPNKLLRLLLPLDCEEKQKPKAPRDAYADIDDDYSLYARDFEPDYVIEKRGLDGAQVEALAARSPTLSEILVREIENAR